MSEASLREKASVDSLVARVADEYLERQKNGEKPDIEEYAARHPEAADLLRKVLASLELIALSQSGLLAGMFGLASNSLTSRVMWKSRGGNTRM
jgi:hypothetical protein